jgi:hypothetical protein
MANNFVFLGDLLIPGLSLLLLSRWGYLLTDLPAPGSLTALGLIRAGMLRLHVSRS